MRDDAQFDQGMALLTARFLSRLSERQQRLQQGLAEWQAQPARPPETLLRELHSLAGAARLFAHDALGEQARSLELALPGMRPADATPPLQALLQAMQQLGNAP